MALDDRPGLSVGTDADLGPRQLAAPGGPARSHLVTKAQAADAAPGSLIPALQHLLDRVTLLEHRSTDQARRIAVLEAGWGHRLRLWLGRLFAWRP